jgi:NAD(P)-dependent dehydrogenase (short-subunit alcohol dehydrogenase family)
MMRQLALTTGASIGIGQVFAERLVEQRYDLVLVGRRKGRLDSFAASITGAAVHVACLGSRKRSSTPCKAWISPEYSRRLKPPTDLIDLLMRSDPSCLDQLCIAQRSTSAERLQPLVAQPIPPSLGPDLRFETRCLRRYKTCAL